MTDLLPDFRPDSSSIEFTDVEDGALRSIEVSEVEFGGKETR